MDGVLRDLYKRETRVSLGGLPCHIMNMKETVLVMSVVGNQPRKQLPEIGFIASGLSSKAVDVNGDLHENSRRTEQMSLKQRLLSFQT